MPTWPSTFSTRAAFRYPGETREHPALTFVADNRVMAARSIVAASRWDEIKVQATLTQADVDVLYTFFDARKGLVETFTYTHPTLGSITARFKESKLPRARLIKGTHSLPDLYEIEFTLEQPY